MGRSIHDPAANPLVEEGKILYWGHGGVAKHFGKWLHKTPIHPKCGEEACDLVGHSSKVWGRSM